MVIHRCCRCMEKLPVPGGVCPHCGFDNTRDLEKQPSYVLPCGTILSGRYLMGQAIGKGGFGITYIAWDLTLEQTVCIKEYFPEGAALRSAADSQKVVWASRENPEELGQSLKSFVKESQKAVKLRDLAHVVSVWGIFYANETAYIVMDYIRGETLRDYLAKGKQRLSERECVELLAPMMEDLKAVHARGIIHRDIKPDNIMLRETGEPILLDLGAAKELIKTTQSASSSSSTHVVSQGFSPPEQYREHGSIGPWTDVYALCATIYYCISGQAPPPAIDRLCEDTLSFRGFSPGMERVLRKGLATKAEERIQKMDTLLQELTAALRGRRHSGPSTRTLRRVLLPLAAAALLLIGVFRAGRNTGPAENVSAEVTASPSHTPPTEKAEESAVAATASPPAKRPAENTPIVTVTPMQATPVVNTPSITASPLRSTPVPLPTEGRSTRGTYLSSIEYDSQGRIVRLTETEGDAATAWEYVYREDGSFQYRVKSVGAVKNRISEKNFPGYGLHYRELPNPVHDCVGFTLAYRIYDVKGGSGTGERNMYIRDTSEGWTKIGTFAYPTAGETMQTEFRLDKPRTVSAFATPREHSDSSSFNTEQELVEVWVADYTFVQLAE